MILKEAQTSLNTFFNPSPALLEQIVALLTPRPLMVVMLECERFVVWLDGVDKEPRLCRNGPRGSIYISGGPIAFNPERWLHCMAIPFIFYDEKENKWR